MWGGVEGLCGVGWRDCVGWGRVEGLCGVRWDGGTV